MNKDYLKNFYKFTVEDFTDFHKKAYPHANERTHKSFNQSLKRIEIIYKKPLNQLQLCFLDDAKDTFEKFKSTDYSHQTNITTFCMLLKILKMLSVPIDQYNKFQNILNLEVKKNNIVREEDLHEKLNFLPSFEEIRNLLREKIDDLNETSTFDDVKYLLILSMMVLSVPLKLMQYTKMGIVFVKPESKYMNNFLVEDQEGNFYVKSGEITIKINDSHLIKLIKLWINEYNTTKHFFIQHEQAKTGMNNKQLRIALNTASRQYLGEALSNGEIRSLYMKNLMDLDPSFKEKLQVSSLLGYKNNNILELHKV